MLQVVFLYRPSENQIINLSTDGRPSNPSSTITARDDAVTSGVDIVNAIGIGASADIDFLERVVWPQPASVPPTDGFVVPVDSFEEYVQAIKDQIRFEVSGGTVEEVKVPTMTEWGMIVFATIAGIFAFYSIHVRRQQEFI